MGNPPDPEKAEKKARKIAERTKSIAKKIANAGQKAAGEAIRGSDLPFEKDGSGRRTATIPTPDGGSISVTYDPKSPPESDFGFSSRDPDNNPRKSSVKGTEKGEVPIKPMDVGPAIEKATGVGKAHLIVHFGLDAPKGGRAI